MPFMKDDASKPQLAYLPSRALEDVARVMDYGAAKYDRDNWRKCSQPLRMASAALRHIFARLRGERIDPESGLPHLAHAATCLLMWYEIDTDAPTAS